MTAKEYFKEEISGEPLTEEWIIYHLKAFSKIKCKEQKRLCSNTYDNVKDINKNKTYFKNTILDTEYPEF
jgi:hypothetical protein